MAQLNKTEETIADESVVKHLVHVEQHACE